jgi:hypothetical protein
MSYGLWAVRQLCRLPGRWLRSAGSGTYSGRRGQRADKYVSHCAGVRLSHVRTRIGPPYVVRITL